MTVNSVVASTVIWMAAVPLVALRFHIVSPISILLNIPLIPITSVALLFGGLGLGLSAVWGPLGGPASWTAGLLLQWTQPVVRWGVAPWGHGFTAGPSWEWVLIFYGLLGLATFFTTSAARSSQVGRLARSAPGALMLTWTMWGLLLAIIPVRLKAPEAELLAVGHGLADDRPDARGPDLLYDAEHGDPTWGRGSLHRHSGYAGSTGSTRSSWSHADQGHYNGLPDLLDRFPIGTVRIPQGFGGPANPRAVELIREIRSRNCRPRDLAPEAWESAGVRFTVQHPFSGWYPQERTTPAASCSTSPITAATCC